jgi:hypothetical protein
LSPYNVIILYRTPVVYKDVTFDPVPLYIICMRLGPSIPGVYVNPGFWTPKIRVLQCKTDLITNMTLEGNLTS